MGFYVTLIYIAFLVLSPAVIFPQLATFRVQIIVGGLAVLVTLVQAPLLGYPIRAIQNVLVAAFFGWACASWVLHGWLGGAITTAQDLAPVLVVFFLLAGGVRTIGHLRMVSILMVCLSLYAGLRGVLAIHFNNEWATYVMTQFVDNDYLPRVRFVGVLSDPNDLAQFHLTVLPMLLMLWKPKSPIRNFILVGPILAFDAYAVFLTHSRGVLVGLAFLLMVYLRRRFNPVIMSIGTVAAAVGLIGLNFSGGRSVSFGAGSDRIEAWGVGLSLLKGWPLHGAGYNSFTDHHEVTAHNSFVLCFSELGLVGFFLWMAIIVCCFMQLNSVLALSGKNAKVEPLMRWVRMVHFSFTGFLATAWFLSRAYEALFWIMVGLSTAIAEMARRELAADPATATSLPAVVKPALRDRVRALVQGWPPPKWAQTTAGLQFACIFVVYILVRLRWAG